MEFLARARMRSGISARVKGVAVVAGLACALTAFTSTAPAFVELAVANRSNETPTIAAAGTLVAVAWSATTPEGVTDIYAAVSRDGGRAFSTPVRVNDVAGDARVTGEQAPQVVLATGTAGRMSISVVWTTKGPRGTRLMQARSDDGGPAFAHATRCARQ